MVSSSVGFLSVIMYVSCVHMCFLFFFFASFSVCFFLWYSLDVRFLRRERKDGVPIEGEVLPIEVGRPWGSWYRETVVSILWKKLFNRRKYVLKASASNLPAPRDWVRSWLRVLRSCHQDATIAWVLT